MKSSNTMCENRGHQGTRSRWPDQVTLEKGQVAGCRSPFGDVHRGEFPSVRPGERVPPVLPCRADNRPVAREPAGRPAHLMTGVTDAESLPAPGRRREGALLLVKSALRMMARSCAVRPE